jgi:hypothetical protein
MRIEAPERAEFTYIFLQRPGELFHCFTKPNFLAQGTRHGFTLVVILRLNTTQRRYHDLEFWNERHGVSV